ncbi:MAG: hypothetical protein DI585_01245 [Pseudomonas fluorescens]|nr:MAG: hypothetical protein DI585_01245 [Pseudomonas fluorescens]
MFKLPLTLIAVVMVVSAAHAAMDMNDTGYSSSSLTSTNSLSSGGSAAARNGFSTSNAPQGSDGLAAPATSSLSDAEKAAKSEAEKAKKACEDAKAQQARNDSTAAEKNVQDKCNDIDVAAKEPESKFKDRMFSNEMEKTDNVFKQEKLEDVNVLKASKVDPKTLTSQQVKNMVTKTNTIPSNFGGAELSGVEAKTVDLTSVKSPNRTWTANSFVNPQTSTPQQMQDFAMATTGKNANGLVVNADGQEGWYAMNQKTGKREFIPVSELTEKGVAIGQNTKNGVGGYGDHRAAAGNLKDHSHQGNDYMNKKGEGIYSNVSGEVIAVGKGSGNIGNRIQVKTADGKIVQLTGHMDTLNSDLKVGSKVGVGDLLGTVGNSGAEWSGDHLHIELRNSSNGGLGTPMDPVKVTQSMYSDTSSLTNWMNGTSTSSFQPSTSGGNGGFGGSSALVAGGAGGSGGASGGASGGIASIISGLTGSSGNNLLSTLSGGQGNAALVNALVQQMFSGSSGSGSGSTGSTTSSGSSGTTTTTTTSSGGSKGYDVIQALKEICGDNLSTTLEANMLKVNSCGGNAASTEAATSAAAS